MPIPLCYCTVARHTDDGSADLRHEAHFETPQFVNNVSTNLPVYDHMHYRTPPKQVSGSVGGSHHRVTTHECGTIKTCLDKPC